MSSGFGVRRGSPSAPGSAGGSPPKRKRRIVAIAIWSLVGVAVLFGYGALVAGQVSRYWLDHHGVLARVSVIRAQTIESDSEDGTSYQYYVYVEIPRKNVVVRLGVSGPTFPAGSTILIRYDPNDPTHAIGVQNAPFPVGLVIVTGFLLLVVVVAVSSTVATRRQRERWQAKTAALGMSYESKAPPLVERLASLGPGPSPSRFQCVTGMGRGMRLMVFNCDVGSGDASNPYRVTAVESSLTYPHLWIRRRSRARVGKKSPGAALPVVAIGSPGFAQAFEVRCADSWFAGSVLDASLQRWLLGSPLGSQYEFVASRVYVVTKGKMTLGMLEETMDRGVEFVRHLPAGATTGGIWTASVDGWHGEAVDEARVAEIAPAPVAVGDATGQWLSPSTNGGDGAWARLETVMRTGGTVRGPVIEASRAGLVVDVGLRGFLPKSRIGAGRAGNLNSYVGQELECKVVEVDRQRNNVVLSRRELLV